MKNALTGSIRLLNDLLAQNLRLGRLEAVRVQLVLDCNGQTVLLLGQVDGEDPVYLYIPNVSVT